MGKELGYIINHVFLPPQLPHKDDNGVEETRALIEMVLAAAKLFQAHLPEKERSELVPCIKMIGNMLELKDESGKLRSQKVEKALRNMSDGGTN